MTANHDRAPLLTQIAQNLQNQLGNPTLANSPVIKEVLAKRKAAKGAPTND